MTVTPVFESLQAGCLRPYEAVVDWDMTAVESGSKEEACIDVLVYGAFFASDDGGEWFCYHGSLFPFVRCCEVE